MIFFYYIQALDYTYTDYIHCYDLYRQPKGCNTKWDHIVLEDLRVSFIFLICMLQQNLMKQQISTYMYYHTFILLRHLL